MWVISPEFFRDKICEIGANFSLRHLGPSNIILVIMETQLELYPIPGRFVSLMSPHIGITRVRYTENEEGNALFWAKMEAFLPSWTTDSCI